MLAIISRIILGIVCGCVVGIASGFASMLLLAQLSVWANPDDPSAGSVAIMIIFLAPAGAVVGAIVGVLTAFKYPKYFYLTFLPVSIFIIGLLFSIGTTEWPK